MRTRPANSRATERNLIPGFIGRAERMTSGGSAFQHEHVQAEAESSQGEEKDDVLGINDALHKSVKVALEAEVRHNIHQPRRKRQIAAQEIGEHAPAEQHQEEADKDADDETDDLVLGARGGERAT